MADVVRWGTRGATATAIAGAGTSPTLRNLAPGERELGTPIDNSASGHMWADWELVCRFGTAPPAGAYVALYLVPAVDGITLADGSDAVEPSSTCFVGAFPVRPVTTAQRLALRRLSFPSGVFAPLIVNVAGQSMTDVADENVLRVTPYGEQIG